MSKGELGVEEANHQTPEQRNRGRRKESVFRARKQVIRDTEHEDPRSDKGEGCRSTGQIIKGEEAGGGNRGEAVKGTRAVGGRALGFRVAGAPYVWALGRLN